MEANVLLYPGGRKAFVTFVSGAPTTLVGTTHPHTCICRFDGPSARSAEGTGRLLGYSKANPLHGGKRGKIQSGMDGGQDSRSYHVGGTWLLREFDCNARCLWRGLLGVLIYLDFFSCS